MFRPRVPLAIAAVVCGLGLSLSACSAGAEQTESPAPAGSSAPAEAPEQTEETTGDDGSGTDGKPAKEDVVAGYAALIEEQMGSMIPDGGEVDMEAIVTEVAQCFVDEVYDEASVQTLEALAASDAAGIDPADTQLFTDAQGTCTEQITQSIQEQMGG
ncbi:hypothetical protein DT076_03025 [Desertihabitans brevis]|uniref:DUF732 domain-containing protein n=1 Tax=Desertihabitans brevis TaxID=2268447 RepID=A0A367YZQ7_9ACTN|nr:hypothetical protein [Desertihabitans brevis]RCK71403.1 hypothetical protein DT076_03025 [Desertihabitans brevis]